jgi:hypothetical protein
MWGGEDKVWTHYRTDVMAADASAAETLMAFLRFMAVNRLYAHHLEVVDLQRYKVIRKLPKVRQALRERMHLPFVFAVGKN